MASDRILKNLLRFNDLKGDVARITQEIAKCKPTPFCVGRSDAFAAVNRERADSPIGDLEAQGTTQEVELLEKGLLVKKLESVCDALEEVSDLNCELFELSPKRVKASSMPTF
jgi:hypothetical protein